MIEGSIGNLKTRRIVRALGHIFKLHDLSKCTAAVARVESVVYNAKAN
jgi:hypothetical protein